MKLWFAIIGINIKTHIPGQGAIWNAYNQFIDDLTNALKKEKYSEQEIHEIPIGEFIKFANDWITSFQS